MLLRVQLVYSIATTTVSHRCVTKTVYEKLPQSHEAGESKLEGEVLEDGSTRPALP